MNKGVSNPLTRSARDAEAGVATIIDPLDALIKRLVNLR